MRMIQEIKGEELSMAGYEKYLALKSYINMYITKRDSGYYSRVFDLDHAIYIGDTKEELEYYIEQQAAVYHL